MIASHSHHIRLGRNDSYPHSTVRKLRHREGKQPAQDHTVRKVAEGPSHPGLDIKHSLTFSSDGDCFLVYDKLLLLLFLFS